jgi:hypothetical protein
MPWRLRQRVTLILFGCVMLVACGVVLALNQNAATDILGAVGVVGGVAIIINALPTNGDDPDRP